MGIREQKKEVVLEFRKCGVVFFSVTMLIVNNFIYFLVSLSVKWE